MIQRSILLFLFAIGALHVFSQSPIFEIQEGASLDSVFQLFFKVYEYDDEQIERTRKYGWAKKSDKMNADSFYTAAKEYCIQRVGKDYFYENFYLDFHSFKDDPASNVFTLTFRFYPPGFKNKDYINIVFKKLIFLNVEEDSFPGNLPGCSEDAAQCLFPIDREQLAKIVQKELIKTQNKVLNIRELTSDLHWHCTITENGWAGENFYVDARTGEIKDVKSWRRID